VLVSQVALNVRPFQPHRGIISRLGGKDGDTLYMQTFSCSAAPITLI
jgi:hypothetical protein